MEIVRKINSMNSCRNYENGLLPFVKYNSDDPFIYEVKAGDEGNYGQYVCDFVFKNGKAIADNSKQPRMKYLDILRRYLDSKEIMETGILVRQYESGGTIYWTNKIPCEYLPEAERFGCSMADINKFNKDIDGNYTTSETYEHDKYLLLVRYYGTIEANNKFWNDWWTYWWGQDESTGIFDYWEEKYLSSEYINPKECYRFIWDFERYILGKIFVPEYYNGSAITGTRVPQFVNYTNYGQYIEKIDSEERGTQKWKECGGQAFRDFLVNIKPTWISKRYVPEGEIGLIYGTPEIEINVLLENEVRDEMLGTPYEYSIVNDNVVLVEKEYDSGNTKYNPNGNLKPSFVEFSNVFCESKIDTLYSEDAINIDNNLFGRFTTFEDNKGVMHKCTYRGGKWVYETGITETLRCADGENVQPNTKVYRNMTIVSCIEDVVENPEEGDYYYILARYDNSEYKLFTYPFKKGEPCNIELFDDKNGICDVITEISKPTDEGFVTIEYVIGAEYKIEDGVITINSTENGIHYEETFKYESGSTKIYIDGQYYATLWYEKLSNDGLYKVIYNSDLKLSRQVKLAQITGMEVGTEWTDERAVEQTLFTREGTETLQEEPIYKIDLTFDRGAAAAWENHFKLMECNTMEDLQKYGNNFFKL